jgi:hypothetical protein
MKGIIFNLLEQAITSNHGEDTWDDLLVTAGLDGVYTSLGSYGDDSLQGLVAAAASKFAMTPFAMLRWFGQQAMPLLYARYPAFFDPHSSARPFLLSVNSIIHPEVLKVYSNANVPMFQFRDAPDGGLFMGYRSPRRMCALVQGLAEGAGEHFRETVHFEHRTCMLNGDESCLGHLSFTPAQALSPC